MIERKPLDAVSSFRIQEKINQKYFLLFSVLFSALPFAYGVSELDATIYYWVGYGLLAYCVFVFFEIINLKRDLEEGEIHILSGIMMDKFKNVFVRKGRDEVVYYIGVESEITSNRYEFEVSQRQYDNAARFDKIKVYFVAKSREIMKIEKA